MSKETDLVLAAIDMGLHARNYHPGRDGDNLVHHSDAGSQYTSFRFTQHLLDAGIDASIGTVGECQGDEWFRPLSGGCSPRSR